MKLKLMSDPAIAEIEPERIYETRIPDDYYRNTLTWSHTNIIVQGTGEMSGVGGILIYPGLHPISMPDSVDSVSSAPRTVSDSGVICAVGTGKSGVHIVDVDQKQTLRSIDTHSGARVCALAWNPAGWLASGSHDCSISVHDPRTGSDSSLHLKKAHEQAIIGLTVSSDGRWLASGSNDHTVNVWDCAQLKVPLFQIKAHSSPTRALAFCPGSPWLLATGAGVSDNHIRTWDLRWDSEESAKIDNIQIAQVCDLCWSSDGSQLAAGLGFSSNGLHVFDMPAFRSYKIVNPVGGRGLNIARSPDDHHIAFNIGSNQLVIADVFHGSTKVPSLQELCALSASHGGVDAAAEPGLPVSLKEFVAGRGKWWRE